MEGSPPDGAVRRKYRAQRGCALAPSREVASSALGNNRLCHHGAIHTTPAFASPEGHPAHSTPTRGTTWVAGRSLLLANGVARNGKKRNGGGAEGSLDLKHGWRAVVCGRSASIPEASSGKEAVGGRQTPRRAYARTGCERTHRQSIVSLWEGGLKTDRFLGVGSGAGALTPVQNEASESAAERPQLQFPVAGQLAQFGKASAVAGDCMRRRSGTSWMRSRTAAERNPPARGPDTQERVVRRLAGGAGSTLVRHTEEGLGALNDPRRSPCSRNSRGRKPRNR